ncbi:hypothetical protein GQ53DRAFT_783155 [Thozetella sp. PMI_491]|nr:hypothetical protein GQ53DRAFT_783155 [Thozetella sp. PMI_491]
MIQVRKGEVLSSLPSPEALTLDPIARLSSIYKGLDSPELDAHLRNQHPDDNQHLPLPSVYTADATESKFCLDRFSHLYLENLRSTSIQYCGPPSTSSLTCFHSHTSQDDFRDSMCIGDGAVLQSGKFALDCEVRPPDASEVAQGLIPFESMRSYWYDTGPRYVFDSFVQLGTLSSETATQRARFFALLVKREGDVNPWHCLMEVFSMGMTFDVLRMSRDPANNGKPFFNMPEDMENTQVIILDDRDDGPYFDLWRLFSGRDPVRLADIQKHPDLEELLTQNRHRIIVPLAGASNTIWQNDWAIRDCKRAELLDAFVRRVPGYYGIEALPPSYPEGKDIRITFIDRKDSRRLKDQESLFAALRGKYPTVDLEVVDFAALPFPEQIRIAARTDILVGVHGAALTHTMFMRKGEGAIVEIHPSNMSPQYRGFQNLANMMGLGYFDTHAINTTLKQKRQDWHIQDFEIDVDEFVNLVGVTVRSLYNKGGQAHDMV